MSKRTVVTVDCDGLGGRHSGDVATIQIGIDGASYEIDLCAAHLKPVDETLTMIVRQGRKVTARQSPRRQRSSSPRQNSSAVREWANQNGMKVSERGRIPANVLSAYEHRADPKFTAA